MENHIFDGPPFENYTLDKLQNYELLLQDEMYIEDYKQSIADQDKGVGWKPFGYVCFVVVKRVTLDVIELSFFPNTFDRLHELPILLPHDQVITCVQAWNWDERPTLFVKSEWLQKTLSRLNRVFGLIDAIGVKNELATGKAMTEQLAILRSGLDAIAARYPQIDFVSFADNVLIKSHWSIGVKYTYDPEALLNLFTEIRTLFKESLGLAVYGVFTQGSNEYYTDSSMHISATKNHVCLNCLGAPYADLLAIDNAARQAFKQNPHSDDLYLDELYFNSLRLDSKFKQSVLDWNSYTMSLSRAHARYARVSCDQILKNLKPSRKKTLVGS